VKRRAGIRSKRVSNAVAGLPGAIGSVPDGMASAVLVGVSPIHGLYASAVGPVVGGLTTSTRLMVVTTTTAAALAAGSAVSGYSAEDRPAALFLATLFLPVAAAVGLGVALSLLLQLNQEAMDLRVVRLEPQPDGRFAERPAPATLTGGVTVLDVYGSLLYAGARTLQARLPRPDGADRPAVVLRLRGRTSLGATFLVVVTDYARQLAVVGGRLYLTGTDRRLAEWFHRSGGLALDGPIRIVQATEVVGESTARALRDAETWLVATEPTAPTTPAG
jgi:SulP family sulfate permease